MPTNKYYTNPAIGYAGFATGKHPSFFSGEYRRYFLNRAGCSYTASTQQSALVIDFVVPTGEIIDEDVYDITAIRLKIYITSLDVNSDQSPTPVSNTITNLNLFLRNAMTGGLDIPHSQVPNTNANESAIYNYAGTNILTSTSLAAYTNAWNTLNISPSYYSNFFSYQSDGFISLILKRTAISTSQVMFIALDGHADGTYKPVLEIDYVPKQEPGIISSFDLADVNTLKYVDNVPVLLNIKDSEGDNQTVTIEGRARMADDCSYGDYTSIPIAESNILAAPLEGYVHSLTMQSPFRKGSIATTRSFRYYQAAGYESGIFWEGNTLVIPGDTQDFYDTITTGKDLKINTMYRLGVVHDEGNGAFDRPIRVRVYQPLLPPYTWIDTFLAPYDEGDPSTYVTFNSGSNNNTVQILLNGYSDSPQTRVTEIVLREHAIDLEAWDCTFRAKLADNDGSSAYFDMPRVLEIDGRAPHAPVITDLWGSSPGVFQTTASGHFDWDPVTVPGNIGISGYRWIVDSIANTAISSGNAFTANTELVYEFPWDNKWYLHVAAQADNGLIGQTTHYPFFYNVPASFNEASGVFCNGVRLYSDSTQWINYDLRPRFTWVRPDEDTYLLTYSMEVGIEGGVSLDGTNGYPMPEFLIDWDVIPEEFSIEFRLYITDNVGIRYALKDTTNSVTNWQVFDNNTDQWINISSLSNEVVPRTKIGNNTQYRYNKVRYKIVTSDHIPDHVPLVATIQLGYYDDNATNYVWDEQTQPKYISFTDVSYARHAIFQMGHLVPANKIMSLFAQISNDNFISNLNSYTTVEHYKSFVEVARFDPETKFVCYFNTSGSPKNEVDNVTGTATNSARYTTSGGIRTTGNYTWKFNGVGAKVDFGERYDPYLRRFGVAFWFKVNAPSGGVVQLIQKGGYANNQPGFWVNIDGSGNLNAFVGDGTNYKNIATAGKDYRDNTWYHCVLNFNKTSLDLYINDALVKTATCNVTGNIDSPSNLLFGQEFDGWLDDAIFRHEPFTQDEIYCMNNWTLERTCIGLEIPISTVGVIGNGAFRTLRMVVNRGTYLAPGSYKWRYKKTVDGVQDSSFTTAASSVNLAAAAPISYVWNFDNPEISVSELATPEYRPTDDLLYTARAYFARFRVFDGYEYGDWSNMFKFRINEKPVAPTNLFIQ